MFELSNAVELSIKSRQGSLSIHRLFTFQMEFFITLHYNPSHLLQESIRLVSGCTWRCPLRTWVKFGGASLAFGYKCFAQLYRKLLSGFEVSDLYILKVTVHPLTACINGA